MINKSNKNSAVSIKTTYNSLKLSLPLFIIFLILKLFGAIDWSWLWVASPLWLPIAIPFALIIALMVFVICVFIMVIPLLLLGKKDIVTNLVGTLKKYKPED